MSNLPLILSGPGQSVAPVPSNQWGRMTLTLVGPDGVEWDLNNKDGGVLLDRRGVEGLHFPRIEKFKSRSRAVHGARARGWRADVRDVFLPIYLWSDSTDSWIDRHNAFFSAIHPSKPAILRVKAKETRELVLTGVFEETHSYEVDPTQRGWERYGVTLEADQPYWQGPLIVGGPWAAPKPTPFFKGPPFHIISASSFGSATIRNPGDVTGHGTWWIKNALSSIELGVNDSVVTVPFDVPNGQMLRIDTNPGRPRAVMGPVVEKFEDFVGVDMTKQMGLQSYAGVEPGASVDLRVEGAGSGSIEYHVHPQHFRAF